MPDWWALSCCSSLCPAFLIFAFHSSFDPRSLQAKCKVHNCFKGTSPLTPSLTWFISFILDSFLLAHIQMYQKKILTEAIDSFILKTFFIDSMVLETKGVIAGDSFYFFQSFFFYA